MSVKGIYGYNRSRRDIILENCPITIVIRSLLVYSTILCSFTIVIILDESKCHRTLPQYIMSCSVVHNNVMIL